MLLFVMESNHMIVDYSPSSTNPTPAELILSELSGGRDLTNPVDQDQTSALEHVASNSRVMKWTDEKHGLYLKSMEAAFVNQLHDSVDILGWTSHKYPSTQQHISNHNMNSSGQYKVFREGWRGHINFRREEAEVNKGDEAGVVQITSNPWIRRYRSECRLRTRTPVSVQEDFVDRAALPHSTRPALAKTDVFPASGFYVRHRVSNRIRSGHSLEVTDQNFVDEDTKDENECDIQSAKRIKNKAFSNED